MSTTHFGSGRIVIVSGNHKISMALLAAMSMSTVMLPAPSSQAQPAPSAYYGDQGRTQTNQQQESTSIPITPQRDRGGLSFFYGNGSAGPPRKERRGGPGWTHAHVQRQARKERNRQRNKRAKR